ncbi:dihydrofolate reductase family protein [Janibacter sp. GS2]|uniref:dihydrofolate reductase family protein n=1 Tax=Janibacter sp. GS2 TaxID=3442646 RepID=UPI003EB947A0
MGRLTYGMLVSLDGYVRGPDGGFEWAEPDAQLHDHFTETQAGAVVDVYGRHMWETMRYWQDPPAADLVAPQHRGFAEAWQATDTVVVSRSLSSVDTARTQLWPHLDLDRLRAMVETCDGAVTISGPTLAASALRAGLVDEVSAYVVPYVAGGGLRFLPDGFATDLRLRHERRFGGGTVELVYDVRPTEGGPS